MEESQLRRLAFIKYLFHVGENQSRQPEPLCGTAVLSFHDCIELFLELSCEKLSVFKKDVSFMKYWDVIDAALSGHKLSQKASMNRLNKTRVNLKHHGVIPSKLEIDEYRTLTATFLSENYLLIFNVEFDDISLIDMIKYEQSKCHLKQAQKYYFDDNPQDSLVNIAISFSYLIKEYEDSFRGKRYISPFNFGNSMAFLNAFHIGIKREDGKIKDFIDNTSKAITEMQNALKIICFGIDYKKYAKFKMLTPHVVFTMNGKPSCTFRDGLVLNKGIYNFCHNFIIESSLSLQEFDYNIE
jgi:mRNA-degrading endonuclease HigB of HigAB toxin-antitoxin module